MDGKTEVIEMDEINKGLDKSKGKKKKNHKNKKVNLGIWKYFIAIGGVAIVAMIFVTLWFYNSRGGLVKIDKDTYLGYNKVVGTKVVYVGSNDAISNELTPVLQKIAEKRHKQYEYLDVQKLSPEDFMKISSVFAETKDYVTIPMILVIKDGKIVDTRTDKTVGVPTGMQQGYLDEARLIDFLKQNKVY